MVAIALCRGIPRRARRFFLPPLLAAGAACSSLPDPLLPLSPTPDAPFRTHPPIVEGATPLAIPDVEQFALDTGLTVYVANQAGTDLVSIRYVGRRDPYASDGFDLPSAVTAMVTATAPLRPFDVIGAQTESSSRLSITAPREHLADALRRLGASLAHPRFDPEYLRALHAGLVSRTKLSQYTGIQALRHVVRLQLGRDIEGMDARQDTEEPEERFAERFTPSESALVIAGDVRRADVERVIREAFGALPARKRPKGAARLGAFRSDGTIHVIDLLLPQATVAIATPAPSFESEEGPAFALLAAVVAGAQSSWMFRSVRLDSGASYGVVPLWKRDVPVFSLFVMLSADSVIETMDKIVANFERARTEVPGPEDLEPARSSLLEEMAAQFETPSYTTEAVADSFVRRSSLDDWPRLASAVARVQGEELRRVARRYWAPELRATAIAGHGGDVRALAQWSHFSVKVLEDEP